MLNRLLNILLGRRSDVGSPNSGRSALPTYANQAPSDNLIYPTDDFLKYLPIIRRYAVFDPDISHHVSNLVKMSATPYRLSITNELSDEEKVRVKTELLNRSTFWYGQSEGLDAFIRDAISQLAIYGCLSYELVFDRRLTGLRGINLISPETIRFKYNRRLQCYEPYQILRHDESEVKLNPYTYSYRCVSRYDDGPYAVPPILSSLGPLQDLDLIWKGIRNIVGKFGATGFMDVLVTKPGKANGESNSAYFARIEKLLTDTRDFVEVGLDRGYSVGFKGSHEYKMTNVNQNVQGVDELLNAATLRFISGLKTSGVFLSRNFTTTETFARVLLNVATQEVGVFHSILGVALKDIFQKAALMMGQDIVVDFTFETPMYGDRLKAAQGTQMTQQAVFERRDQGIISQQAAANELGYIKAEEEGPVSRDGPNMVGISGNDMIADEGEETNPRQSQNPRSDNN